MPIPYLQANTTLNSGYYKIKKELGRGGFGNTYLVEIIDEDSLEKLYVVKEFAGFCTRNANSAEVTVIEKNLMEKWLVKFDQEARNLSKINHQNVVRVFKVWQENKTIYYSMEYINGGELLTSMDLEWEPMTWMAAKKIAVALLEALEEVHKTGLLHGDITPANILIREKTGMPVLIDFGTARSLEKVQKTVTSLTATAGYAPIELVSFEWAKKACPASDLYSWAMVVIGLLAKHPSYLNNSGSHEPIDAKIRMGNPKDKYSKKFLRKWLPLVPKSVVSILASCLILDPKERPQSAQIVIEQLKTSSLPSPYSKFILPTFVGVGAIGIASFFAFNSILVSETTVQKAEQVFSIIPEASNKQELDQTFQAAIQEVEQATSVISEAPSRQELDQTFQAAIQEVEQATSVIPEAPSRQELDRAFQTANQEVRQASLVPTRTLFSLRTNVEEAIATMNGVQLPGLPITNVFMPQRPFTILISADDYEELEVVFVRTGRINHNATLERISRRRRYQIACDNGSMRRCVDLGNIYRRGNSNEEAVRLFRIACNDRNMDGCNNLGLMYGSGRGVDRDFEEAVELHRLACNGRNIAGCYNLGVVYLNGRGVSRDYREAVRRFHSACIDEYENSCELLNTLCERYPNIQECH